MTNTITAVLPKLAAHPEIQDLVKAHFGPDAGAILQGITDSSLDRDQVEELEALITDLMDDHADEMASYQGLGTTSSSPREAMGYFEAHHSEAYNLIQAQAKELERLLGRDGAAMALGQKKPPFTIRILRWRSVFVVVAEDFESAWFEEQSEAISFVHNNYGIFLIYLSPVEEYH